MSVGGGEEAGITLTSQDRAVTREPNTGEVQRQILERALQILEDPQAVTLTYPNANRFSVATQGVDPDYEHGSQARIAMLKKPKFLGRDEVCVAIVNNASKDYPVNLGAGFVQLLQGKKSDHTIAVIRFVQTPSERLWGGGTVTKVVLSDTDPTFTGTFSRKGTATPHRFKPDAPTFAEHWQSGNAPLFDQAIYDASTRSLDFTPQDYTDILAALNHYRLDRNLTDKVAKSEGKMRLAKASREPINITPQPKALQPGALNGT